MDCKASVIISRCKGREGVRAEMTRDMDGLRKSLEETLDFLARRIEESHVLKLELVSSIVDPRKDDLFSQGFDSYSKCVRLGTALGDTDIVDSSVSNSNSNSVNNSNVLSSNDGVISNTCSSISSDNDSR